jgi:arylsulfatase A
MVFRHCYSQPLCTPSRVQLMTGLYNHRNYEAFGFLRPDQITFANRLRDAGYATCIVGKWQLGGDASTIRHFGFDEHCLWNVHSYKPTDGSPALEEPPNANNRYRDPVLYRNGEWIRPGADAYGPDVCCGFAESFIERNSARPFLLYYPMILTHAPFDPTPDSADWNVTDSNRREMTKEQQSELHHRHFADMVTYADKLVGRIEAKLAAMGVLGDTVLMFTGDNGTKKGLNTRLRDGSVIGGGKGLTTDGGTRVPLIVWGSGVRQGVETEALVDFSDFMPTLLDVAGATPTPALDGFGFLPVLTGASEGVRETLFCYYEPRFGKPVKEVFARTREYKLYGDGRFYRVPSDTLEQRDLSQGALTPEQGRVRRRLADCIRSKLGPELAAEMAPSIAEEAPRP